MGRLPIKELAIKKNVKLKYLPSYSPQLNPAELCFNFIRRYVETHQARTEDKLKSTIDEAISLLNQQDLTQWFRHCWNYFNEEKKSSRRRKSLDWFKILEVKIPWKKCQPIYPSEKWKRIGENRTTQKLVAVQKRIRRCVLRSWDLVNQKSGH